MWHYDNVGLPIKNHAYNTYLDTRKETICFVHSLDFKEKNQNRWNNIYIILLVFLLDVENKHI
jgi:hypothetical protein